MNVTFEPVTSGEWSRLDKLADRTIFQTKPWLDFIAESQGGSPIVLEIRLDNQVVGYFTGVIIRRAGFRILGSPFPGWTTSYLGFNLIEPVDRTSLLSPLAGFAFRELGCWHFELMDRRLTVEQFATLGWGGRQFHNFEIDLRPSEDEVFAAMKGSCRTSIRKSEKEGVRVEAASDPQFADDYYTQLGDVFAKQRLRPTYSIERVRSLIKHLMPTGNLLLVRASDNQGICIATGIYPAFNGTMYFWGGASLRQYQILQPNEAVQWFAMRHWKARGMGFCDMGGGGEYKRKYGGEPFVVPWCRKSRYEWVEFSRNLAQRAHTGYRRLFGGL